MLRSDLKHFRDLLYSVSKMKAVEMRGKDSIILEVFCEKVNDLAVDGKLANETKNVIQCMLSIHLAAIRDGSGSTDSDAGEITDRFWEPLFV